MQRKIEKQEWADWLLDPVTQALREQYAADLQRLKDEWARGAFEKDRERDAYVRGQCGVLQQFLDLDHSDLESE